MGNLLEKSVVNKQPKMQEMTMKMLNMIRSAENRNFGKQDVKKFDNA